MARVLLVSALTLKEHHNTMMRKSRGALGRLRRLAGSMGLVPVNVRHTQVACVQAVALY